MFWGELLSFSLLDSEHRLRLFFHDLGFGSFICFLRKKKLIFFFVDKKGCIFQLFLKFGFIFSALDFEDLLFVLTCKPVVLCFVKSFLFWSMWLLRKLYLRILYLNLVSFFLWFFFCPCLRIFMMVHRSLWFWWVR